LKPFTSACIFTSHQTEGIVSAREQKQGRAMISGYKYYVRCPVADEGWLAGKKKAPATGIDSA